MAELTGRDGQWVLVPSDMFSAESIRGLHVVNGYVVGIHYARGDRDRPEVHLVNALGDTAFIGRMPRVALRPLLDKSMVPAARLATCQPDWVPLP
jgi:hypothetical protein